MGTEYLPKVVMSIHAHPDDQEFSIGGTLAKWARAGCEIVSVTITSGDSGSNDPSKGADYKPVLAELREKEQHAANEILGVKETVFMRYPDGELEPTIALRRELTRLIRMYKPDVVLAGNPEAWFYGNEYVNHPDHRAAAQAACEAVFPSAGSRLIFADLLTEGFEPHEVKRLYVHGTEKPDTWVDVSETIDIKVKALQQHASQVPVDEVEKWMKDWAKEDAKDKEFEYAESYRVMILKKEEEHEK
ncbi:MAG TPA: PIG-L family deacetylase [Anaerolineales bacterium]|nr:PIG-L family deacetylase [Anaerolineales bacterium]HNN12191.1 PIG-L family deacetylase [Anaerolineales bacterium]HNO30191.1 PIG-L family deacetylase [Anaerolineales bacterium]